jgi:hypothetical protein
MKNVIISESQLEKIVKNYKNTKINEVDNIKDFYGLEIPEKTKKVIISQIKSGDFDKFVNSNMAKAKLNAYLETRFGEKARETLAKKSKDK